MAKFSYVYILETEDAGAEACLERPRPEVDETRARGVPRPLDLDERGVDPVGAGA